MAFKSYFVAWEPQMWNKKMTYEDQVKAIKQDNEKVDENAWTLVGIGSNQRVHALLNNQINIEIDDKSIKRVNEAKSLGFFN